MRHFILTSLLGIFCFSPIGAGAQTPASKKPPQFVLPVDCALGEDCWVVNYVDVDPAPDRHADFTCGAKTYEGHKGTDFAIRSRAEMERGVDVLAARAGAVLRLRDGEDDLPKSEAEYDAIRANNRDCGNGVVIDHGQGLLTYYCHLKQGSVAVAQGDKVRAGDKIAQIGQSGFSEFPHLHLTVIWEGGHIDPFTGHLKDDGCGKFKDNLWAGELAYMPYSIFDGGFAGRVPDFADMGGGAETAASLSAASLDSLVYWAGFYHAEVGDKLTLSITAPSGEVVAKREHVIETARKRPSFYYTGRKLNGKLLEAGVYTGAITYEKAGRAPKTVTHEVELK